MQIRHLFILEYFKSLINRGSKFTFGGTILNRSWNANCLGLGLTIALSGIGYNGNGTIYTFYPQNDNGNYSVQNNWLNGIYPGASIGRTDTILIKSNNNYKNCIIDINVRVKGYCRVDSGVNFSININDTFEVGLNIYDLPFERRNRLYTEATSQFNIIGLLKIYSSDPVFNGGVFVAGTFNSNVADPDTEEQYGETLNFNDNLEIAGLFFFLEGQVVCKQLIVREAALAKGRRGLNSTSLTVDDITNNGTIELFGCIMSVNQGFSNSGKISSSAFLIQGKCNNKGSIQIKHDLGGSYLINQSGELINSGTLSGSSEAVILSFLNGSVINTGSIWISGPGGPVNTMEILRCNGQLINTNSFSVSSGKLVCKGKISTSGQFNVNGITEITDGIFNNNGTCNWTNYYNSNAKNIITTSFLNAGTLKNHGRLELGNNFLNAGIIEISPF